MLIDELLNEDGAISNATKGLVKGVGSFVKNARGGKDITNPLTGKSVFAYGDNGGPPPQQAFKAVLKDVYGPNLNNDIIDDFAKAIQANDKDQLQNVSKKYKNEQKIKNQPWDEKDKDVIAALLKHYEKNPDKSLAVD